MRCLSSGKARRHCASSCATREETAAQKRAFEGVVAMYPATAESRDLSRRIQSPNRLAICPKRLTGQISLDST